MVGQTAGSRADDTSHRDQKSGGLAWHSLCPRTLLLAHTAYWVTFFSEEKSTKKEAENFQIKTKRLTSLLRA